MQNNDIPLYHSSFLTANQANITILFSNFSDIKLKNIFLNISDIDSIENHSLTIENCVFQNIISYWSNDYYDLFNIQNFLEITIQNTFFKNIKALNIFNIENIFESISFSGVIFESNKIYSHVVNIQTSSNIIMNDSEFKNCNQDFEDLGGGSLRIYNSFNKFFKNINISYCFSSKTAFGLKFIDDSTRKITINQSYVIIFLFDIKYNYLFFLDNY